MSPDAWGGVFVALYGAACFGVPLFFFWQAEKDDQELDRIRDRIRRGED